MKRAYLSPIVTDLGSVSEMTRSRGGAYGEFIANGRVEGRDMKMHMKHKGKGKDGGGDH